MINQLKAELKFGQADIERVAKAAGKSREDGADCILDIVRTNRPKSEAHVLEAFGQAYRMLSHFTDKKERKTVLDALGTASARLRAPFVGA